ncbi:MAG: InlB B-repeat-containing protein, partial [Clostridia bacterium]|nr:InlB B-repeat-containing protein [Clostridia bacterium]
MKIDVSDCQRGVIYYLHAYAIDNAGNKSAEKLYPFVVGNPMFAGVSVTTDITTDKESYIIGEDAYLNITAKASFYKTFAKGVVEIFDTGNNLVDTVESDYIAEITSYEDLTREFVWNVKNISAGDYVASIKWYDGSKLIASDTTQFAVKPDGDITDRVTTDKLTYTTAENIMVSDNIFNNTTNMYENNLELNIDIVNSEDEEVVTTLSATVSSIAGETSVYSDYLKAQDLGIGNYTAVSKLTSKGNLIASSSAQFSVIDFTELNQKYSGTLIVNDNTNKDKLFNYSVTNTGNQDGKALLVKVNVYSFEGELLGTIEKTTDINKGETVKFSELFNTEALKIGSYPVNLTITTNDGKEAVLANSGFEINMINQYTVTFVNDDGTVLDTQQVEYAGSATAPAQPSKPDDSQYTYEFVGWDTDFTRVTKDITVTAIYIPREIPTEPVTEPVTEIPTEPITQTVTDPTEATQKPTEPSTEKITSPATQSPTTATTDKSVVTTGANSTLFVLLLPLLGGFAVATILYGK